ncbi:MAG: regulator of ribonuclease [Pseudonocardiales bacterium]|nr:regulator of ribonuclease [Pseudonocardiales bacterium]
MNTADRMDELGDGGDSCELQLRQYGRRTEFDGPIRTLRCHEDIGLLRELLAQPGDGAVLVVDGRSSLRCAILGDRLAGSAVRNGWSGLVIAGAVRDTRALADIDLGIKAVGSNPRRGTADGTGEIDVPVSFGGTTFVPGQHVWCDDDGVVVTRPSGVRARGAS